MRGNWERALAQLQVAGAARPARPARWRRPIARRCAREVFRAEVFAGRKQPLVSRPASRVGGLLLESLKLVAEGHVEKAEAMRDEALEAAPASGGTHRRAGVRVDRRRRFAPRPGVRGHRRRQVRVDPVRESRAAHDRAADATCAISCGRRRSLTLVNGGETVALIPSRYPGSEASDDPAIRMARKTTWREAGRRHLSSGSGSGCGRPTPGEYPILDTREIKLAGAA